MFTIAPIAATLIRLSLLGSMLADGMVALQAEQEAAGGANVDARISIAQVLQPTKNYRRRRSSLHKGPDAIDHDGAVGEPVDAIALLSEGAAAIERDPRRREMGAEEEKGDPSDEEKKEDEAPDRMVGEEREAVPSVKNPLLEIAENQPMSRQDKAFLLISGMVVSFLLVTIFNSYSTASNYCNNEVWGGEEKAAWCTNKIYVRKGLFRERECFCRSVAVPDCYNGAGKELPEW